jgi:hypothetical protein
MMNEETQQIHLSKVEYEGRMVWFKSLLQLPTDEEMNAWVPRYRETARQRGPRNPLLIDVERDGLRGAASSRHLTTHSTVVGPKNLRPHS